LVLSFSLAAVALGNWACSSSPGRNNQGGTGGDEATGGSGDTGGKGGGSATGGKGGSGTGGSTGGTGGSTGGTGGSTGGSGGSTGGSGGSTGGSGGSTGGTGGGGMGGSKDGGAGDGGMAGAGGATGGPFELKVTGVDMRNGKLYFVRGQTKDTGQKSPGFEWGAHPMAESYALSMYDRTNNSNTHWVMYDIPKTITKLPEALAHMSPAPEAPPAKHTSFGGQVGYFGPGAGSCNTYVFEIHAMKAATTPVSGNNNNIRNTILPANRIAKTAEILVIGNTSAGMCN
jgi:phosphatidylethanolamine-binding protein (PEBP) family uncharacterized protein